MKLFFVLVMLLLVLQLGLSVLVIVLVRFSLYSSDGETDGCLLVPPGAWNEACTYGENSRHSSRTHWLARLAVDVLAPPGCNLSCTPPAHPASSVCAPWG